MKAFLQGTANFLQSMTPQPVINPPIPYRGAVHASEGRTIVISGTIHGSARSFAINLLCGTHHGADIAFHFNPRMHERQVVRNSELHRAWGAEERHGNFPFFAGQGFEIRITMRKNDFEVVVNNSHYCTFNQRTPLARVHGLGIEGDVHISMIRFEQNMQHHSVSHHGGHHGGFPSGGGGAFHPPGPTFQPPSAPPAGAGGSFGTLFMTNVPVPVTTGIPGGIYPGKMIFITATPTGFANQFTVNLQQGPQDQNIAFHFNARFKENNGVVVRNSTTHNSWGSEERHQPYFPFAPNAQFSLCIRAEPHQFVVTVNNQNFVTYNHRTSLSAIDTIKISGDVYVNELRAQ